MKTFEKDKKTKDKQTTSKQEKVENRKQIILERKVAQYEEEVHAVILQLNEKLDKLNLLYAQSNHGALNIKEIIERDLIAQKYFDCSYNHLRKIIEEKKRSAEEEKIEEEKE